MCEYWLTNQLFRRSSTLKVCVHIILVAGTEVVTEHGLVSIESLQAGDWVYAKDDETGEVALRQVVQMFHSWHEGDVIELTVRNQDGTETTFTTTHEHPFWVNDYGWQNAGGLGIQDVLVTLNGEPIDILGIKAVEGRTETFNFEVDDFHTYAIGWDGVWVHNANDPCERVRRRQNDDDCDAKSERAARRKAFRENNVRTSEPNNFKRKPVYGKDDSNLIGPNGEPSELIKAKDVNGKPVTIEHHNHGHEFDDDNTYEKPHYHGKGTIMSDVIIDTSNSIIGDSFPLSGGRRITSILLDNGTSDLSQIITDLVGHIKGYNLFVWNVVEDRNTKVSALCRSLKYFNSESKVLAYENDIFDIQGIKYYSDVALINKSAHSKLKEIASSSVFGIYSQIFALPFEDVIDAKIIGELEEMLLMRINSDGIYVSQLESKYFGFCKRVLELGGFTFSVLKSHDNKKSLLIMSLSDLNSLKINIFNSGNGYKRFTNFDENKSNLTLRI